MGILEVDTVTTLQVHIPVLTKQISNLTHKNNPAPSGENYNFLGYSNNEFAICDVGLMMGGYMEKTNYVEN